MVQNFWSPTPSATGSYGRLADKIQVNFEIFKIGCGPKYYSFNQGTASLQPNQWVSYQSLLLGTTVLNDSLGNNVIVPFTGCCIP